MTILTMEYKYKVFLRLLKTTENFNDACSKAGISIKQAKRLLTAI